jgi:Domain of unknown function (DUF4326)
MMQKAGLPRSIAPMRIIAVTDPTPARLTLSRRAGFNLQAASLALNGLPVVNCGRSGRGNGKWGNPYRIGQPAQSIGGIESTPVRDAADAVDRYAQWLSIFLTQDVPGALQTRMAISTLRGKNLACWCKPGQPCHADILLKLAGPPICEEVK